MPEHVTPTPKRRGRPRGVSDSRERIIAAATDEFAELGYDAATMRGIAARAGVDSALVHHYFGSKADLFTTTVDVPIRPDIDIPVLLSAGRDDFGTHLVRYVLEQWEKPAMRRRGVVMLRTAIGNRMTTPLLAGFLSRELLGRVAARLEVPDADFRASLVASQVAGLLITRYVLELPPMVNASVDELVARIGPTVQRYLFD